jgi:hypothetical protein
VIKPSIMSPLRQSDVPPEHRKDIINMWLFHTEKTDAEGKFVKDKSRIVTLSQLRDPATIGETFSPTVNPISVFTCLQLASTSHSMVSKYDVK